MKTLLKILWTGLMLSVFMIGTAQEFGALKGVVLSEVGLPLEEVNITLLGTSRGTGTAVDGKFTIPQLSPGTYRVEASGLGFEGQIKTVEVISGEVTSVDFILSETITGLSTIMVKGEAFKPKNRAATVNTIQAEEIQFLNLIDPLRITEQIPGISIIDYAQGGTASQFVIRGFNGGHSGLVAVEVDGVSLNESEGHSDGYADLSLIIPINISKMEVFKGPTSVLSGKFAQGGTLTFDTKKGGDYQEISITGGSFDTFDVQWAFGQPLYNNRLKTNFAAQIYRTNGFMENSDYFKANIDSRIQYDLSDNTDVALILKGHESKWHAAGYIPFDQMTDRKNRFKQAEFGEDDGGRKNFLSERINLNHTFNGNLRLLGYMYTVQQDFTRYRTRNVTVPDTQFETLNKRNVYSVGGNLNGHHEIGGKVSTDWVLGTEFYNEFTVKKNWETSNRVRETVDPEEDDRYRVQTFSLFAQGEFEISPYFRPSLGVRLDAYDGSLKLKEQGAQMHLKLNKQHHFSPKIGFVSTLFKDFDLRFSASNGFTIPKGKLGYRSGIDLDPSELWQFEIGANYQVQDWFTIDLTTYQMNSSKEIVEITPGSDEFMNAGKTQRKGIETEIKLNPVEKLNFKGSFAYVETKITANPNNQLQGKELMGVPSTITNLSIDYTLKSGFGAQLSVRDIGSYMASTDNSFKYGGYTVSHGILFYNFDRKSYLNRRIFIQVKNIFDEVYGEYVSNVNNAPAPGRNFMIGLDYAF